jgi:hypothetical protein
MGMLEELTGMSLLRRCVLAILIAHSCFIETENRSGGQAFMAVPEVIVLNGPIQFVAFTPAYLIQFRSLRIVFDG